MPQAMNTPTNLQLPPRRLQQFEASADRKDILAVDGNAKLHRRSCGMPFAEVLPSPHLNKVLLRGCSCRPHGKDTLCKKHAAARDKQLPPPDPSSQVSRHRLRKALHNDGDVCHFEVQISGFRGWQPACTINENVLAQHFALQADRNIRRRRQWRAEARRKKWTGFCYRRPRTFLAPWHSAGPKHQILGTDHVACGVHSVSSSLDPCIEMTIFTGRPS